MQDGYKQAQVETQMAAEEAEGEQRSDAMPTKCNGNFNVNDMLAGNIKASDYFMSLMEFQTFEDVVDEIYNRVTAAGPWAAGSARLPSTLFCIVYKLFIMKLTYKQVTALLTHPDSPYIRCAGFLYLRYVCVPAQLWNWFESFLLDEESFSPSGNPDSTTTIGSWCHGLLTDLKYVRGYVCGGVPCLCARVGGSRTRKTRNDSACVCESSCMLVRLADGPAFALPCLVVTCLVGSYPALPALALSALLFFLLHCPVLPCRVCVCVAVCRLRDQRYLHPSCTDRP